MQGNCCHNSFDVTNGNSCDLSLYHLKPEKQYKIHFLAYRTLQRV